MSLSNDIILCYESMNRYKLKRGVKKSTEVIELYDLENKETWERFDYFEIGNMTDGEIIDKSKELIGVWKGEHNIHHKTILN